MATSYLEELIFKFLDNKLTDKEKKELHTGYDCEKEVDEETEYEMKNALYHYVLRNVAWWKILDKLKQGIESDSESESEEED
jgi:hypothetical protein